MKTPKREWLVTMVANDEHNGERDLSKTVCVLKHLFLSNIAQNDDIRHTGTCRLVYQMTTTLLHPFFQFS
ncbi:Uncharacterized protein APZ42_032477 [Daphnia magna]|uniref:Uncharacterized protein n=1 Tax=Daphnia magna TaxID=35525 RepID=A0A164LKB7_9CRUS|nr:Uncharacterized protein APZ42_032477 [Daphnia magna]